jgi:indole-3-glycerol phosphate synthase
MLDAILADAAARAATARADAGHLRTLADAAPEPRGFSDALARHGRSVIAEIKRRSPSRGSLAPGLAADEQAKRYYAGGAAAVSVLTEPGHFDGTLDDLIDVTRAVDLPVLRKDFLLDPAQVWESRAAGADAVLLIVAVLGPDRLRAMHEAAVAAGVDALVEVHDEAEAEAAAEVGATLIGVNNRDLTSFAVDLGVAERLAPIVRRRGVVTVAESGVSEPGSARRMWSLGYNAILVGEALITSADAEGLVRDLTTA